MNTEKPILTYPSDKCHSSGPKCKACGDCETLQTPEKVTVSYHGGQLMEKAHALPLQNTKYAPIYNAGPIELIYIY